MKPIEIEYIFTLTDGQQETFNLSLDSREVTLSGQEPANLPGWTRLDFHQCSHCPLDVKTTPYCPLAADLVNIVNRFNGLISFNTITLTVNTAEGSFSQDTTAQKAISSLMGLVIATSACPYCEFLKPMARFHRPLSSLDGTIFRAASMYLLAQYFMKKSGQPADLELDGLAQLYQNLNTVNSFLAERLRADAVTDSSINALILLDMYTNVLQLVIEESLEDIRYLFKPFLEHPELLRKRN